MSEPSYQPMGGSGPSGPRAGFWRRFAAALLDGIILELLVTDDPQARSRARAELANALHALLAIPAT